MSGEPPRRRPRMALILDFLLLADVFIFGILFATTANLRLALIVPAVADIGVLSLATTRATRVLISTLLIPVGVALSLFHVPWGWFIAVVGLLISLTFAGERNSNTS